MDLLQCSLEFETFPINGISLFNTQYDSWADDTSTQEKYREMFL